MKTWVTNCPDGFTKKVTADSKEEAVKMVMADPETRAHVKNEHPEFASKTPEELATMMTGMTSEATA